MLFSELSGGGGTGLVGLTVHEPFLFLTAFDDFQGLSTSQ